jgi:hypothetical protein
MAALNPATTARLEGRSRADFTPDQIASSVAKAVNRLSPKTRLPIDRASAQLET